MNSGIIVLEGPDCSGKSTLGKRLAQHTGGVLFHTSWSEDLAAGIWDYHRDIALAAVRDVEENGRLWIFDRSWPSEWVYGAVFRPGQSTARGREIHDMLQEVPLKYVFCMDGAVVDRHEEEKDDAHPYPREKFLEVVDCYNTWASMIHEDLLIRYNLEVDGIAPIEWAKAVNLL